MRNFSIFLAFFLVIQSYYSQSAILCPENKEVDVLIEKAITSNTNGDLKTAITALQKGIVLSKSAGCYRAELSCNKNLMLLYAKQSEYEKALEISKEAERLASLQNDYKNLSSIYTTNATLYSFLGLYEESINQYESALEYAQKIRDEDLRHYEIGFIYYNLAPYYQDISLEKSLDFLKKSKAEIEKIRNNSKDVSLDRKNNMLASINMNLGIFYKDKKNPKQNSQIAKENFIKALSIVENKNYSISIDTKIDLYDALMMFYKDLNEHDKVILYGEKILDLEKSYSVSMPYNRKSAYMQLSQAYLVTENHEKSRKYLDLFTKLNDSINLIEKKSVEKLIKEAISKNEKKLSDNLKIIILSATALIAILIILGLILWNRKQNIYEEIIRKLNNRIPVSETSEELQKTEEQTSTDLESGSTSLKSISIADETLSLIIGKLERFEMSNKFIKSDVNFSFLCNYVGTNSRYLTEILKTHKGKSYSSYINGLRIEYIINLLNDEPKYRAYKIAALGELCGFSSREVFTVTFKKETGITPSYFIENLRKERI